MLLREFWYKWVIFDEFNVQSQKWFPGDVPQKKYFEKKLKFARKPSFFRK